MISSILKGLKLFDKKFIFTVIILVSILEFSFLVNLSYYSFFFGKKCYWLSIFYSFFFLIISRFPFRLSEKVSRLRSFNSLTNHTNFRGFSAVLALCSTNLFLFGSMIFCNYRSIKFYWKNLFIRVSVTSLERSESLINILNKVKV